MTFLENDLITIHVYEVYDCMYFPTRNLFSLREWSSITVRGDYKTGGGANKLLPLQNGGGGGSFSHPEGGGPQQLLG